MVERRADQGGQNGQSGENPFSASYFEDPWTGIGYWVRDADDFLRAAGSRDKGYYGNSSLATLGEPPTFGDRHTRGTPPEE